VPKTKTRRHVSLRAAGSKPCCDPWLLSDRFEFPHHNRQRAALVPMMVGMMVVQVAAMMGSIEAHILLAHILTKRFYT
jgi:hypothetical protein